MPTQRSKLERSDAGKQLRRDTYEVAIAKYCSNALVNMISNPVNSTVPITSEVFKKAKTYDEKMLFGVTTLDVVAAKTFYSGKAEVPVAEDNVPVVGALVNSLVNEDIKALTQRTEDGGTDVVEVNAGKGSATLSVVYAVAIFVACLKVVECIFVQSSITELHFFASKVSLGKNGVEEVLGLGPLFDYEQQGLESQTRAQIIYRERN